MLISLLDYYCKQFCSLRVDRSKGVPAPHKPILLLAVIDGIAKGEICNNQICITPELVSRFKDLWSALVKDIRFTANFALPFFHLQQKDPSRGFWKLVPKPGKSILVTSSNSIRSFAHLQNAVSYAEMDDTLFCLLSNGKDREVLRKMLLVNWFPSAGQADVKESTYTLITEEVLNKRTFETVYEQSLTEEIEFVRSAIFKKEIPRIYRYSCAISGMRIVADRQLQMVDACHIIPFCENGDDSITNGLALCPNLHRAFDRGLIGIDENYCVIAHPFLEEVSPYQIKPLIGQRIILPDSKDHWPDLENLTSHRQKFALN